MSNFYRLPAISKSLLVEKPIRLYALLFLFFCLASSAFSQTYVNGNLSTGGLNNAGVAAPAGTTWSELQAGNTTLGFRATNDSFALADNFVVCGTWDINKITVYGYTIGAVGGFSPFTELRIAIYDTDPSSPGAVPIFGDLTTNQFSGSDSAGIWRVASGSSSLLRKVWSVYSNVNITLTAGTYWLVYGLGNNQLSSSWVPPSTVVGSSTQAGNNGKQYFYYNDVNGVPVDIWTNITDIGPQDLPFQIDYSSAVCTGTPAPGNTKTTTTGAVCPSVAFTLSTSDPVCASGITYKWQYATSLAGPWTDVPGGTNLTLATTLGTIGATQDTYFRCVVTCTSSGLSGISTPALISLTPIDNCYCTSAANSAADTEISNVTLGSTLNNTTTCATVAPGAGSVLNRYSNFTTLTPATVFNGGNTPFSVTVGSCGGAFDNGVAIWIDLNNNTVFEANERLYFSSVATDGPHTETGNLAIPAGITGIRRMRVVNAETNGFTAPATPANIQACGTYGWGETEDYLVNIITPAPCSGTPNPGAATASVSSVCPSVSFNLSITNVLALAALSGITYQWQSSPNNSAWSDIPGATNSTLATSQTTTTWYRLRATCTNGGASNTSTSVQVSISPVFNCYCTPGTTRSTDNDVINNVTFAGINNNSGASGVSGYSDYTSTVWPAPLNANYGIAYRNFANPISVSIPSSPFTEHTAAWIDYNRNGIFDASEFTVIGVKPGTTFSPNLEVISNVINIPSTADTGITRMRVRVRYNTPLTATDPCIGYTFGETEDYLIYIKDRITCSGAPNVGVVSASLSSACPNDPITLTTTTANILGSLDGATLIWESSPDNNTWSAVGSTPTLSLTFSGVSTIYRLTAICSSSVRISDTVWVRATPPTGCYCTSAASTSNNTDITNVTVNSLNNNSDCSIAASGTGSIPNRYSNYATGAGALAPVTVFSGTPNDFSVTVENCETFASSTYIGIWIDFDRDGNFADSERLYVSPAISSINPRTETGFLNIPSSASLGVTRMRIVNSINVPQACSNSGYTRGETEDYAVNIVAAQPCSPTFTPVIESTDTLICSNVPFTLSVQNATGVAGILYRWQSSANGSSWTNNGTTGISYTTTLGATDSFYRVTAQCNLSPVVPSNAVRVRIQTTGCYCTPPASTCTNDYISNVTLGGINNSSTCQATTVGGYINYSATVPPGSITRNSSLNNISVNVVSSPSAPQFVGVWIDYNQNNIFETGEYTTLGSRSTSGVLTGSITVPATALLGETRMRVRVRRNTALASTDACTGVGLGETEDYVVNILSCPPVDIESNPANATITCGSGSQNTSFSVSASAATAIDYKWLVRTSAAAPWTLVSNVAPYSGATTATLSLTAPPLTFNGYQYAVVMTASCLTGDTSEVATLTFTAGTTASFTSQPVNRTVNCGTASTTFTVAATVVGTAVYQWQFRLSSTAPWTNVVNSSTFSGATTATLTVNNILNSFNGYQFRAYASSLCSTADTSSVATLTVTVITLSNFIKTDLPGGTTNACSGTLVTFTDTTNYPLTLSNLGVEWYINNSAVATDSSRGDTIIVNSTNQLVVGNRVSVFSGTGSLPSTAVISSVINATRFRVSVAPTVKIRSGANISQRVQNISAPLGLTYSSNKLVDGNIIRTRLFVNDPNACTDAGPGGRLSNILVMNIEPLTPADISISSGGAGDSVCISEPLNLTATQNTAPLGHSPTNYQWVRRRAGVNSNVGTSALTYNPTDLQNNDSVFVIMTYTAACGSSIKDTSNLIRVKVNPVTTVTNTLSVNPPGTTICDNQSLTFTSAATNPGTTPRYIFRVNGTVVQNSTSNTYNTAALADGDSVDCILVSSVTCPSKDSLVSNGFRFSISASPAPAVALSNPAVCPGATATYRATPTNGGSNPYYVFSRNGVIVQGASLTDTTSSYTYTPVAGDVIKVRLISRLLCVSPDSAITQVTVNVNSTPNAPGGYDTTICGSISIALRATVGTGETVDWYNVATGGSPVSSGTGVNPFTTPIVAATTTYFAQTRNSTTSCVSSTRTRFIITRLAGNSGALAAGTYNIPLQNCGDFPSIDSAVKYINANGIAGNVVFNVAAGYTENITARIRLGSLTLNTSLSGRTLTFQKSGTGANPRIIAYTGGSATPASTNPDGIWSLSGVDNITIDGIDLQENASNSGNALMEYGYGVFRLRANADGSQNNTIRNCSITLSRLNNVAGISSNAIYAGSVGILQIACSSDTITTTPAAALGAAGANSSNKYYTNTISNCNYGIVMYGTSATTSPFADADVNNEIGRSAATGNTVVNFGGAINAAGNPAMGIRLLNQRSSLVSYNTVINTNSGGIAPANGDLRGIFSTIENGASAVVSNNAVTLRDSAATNACVGIELTGAATASGNTLRIDSNTVSLNYQTATTGIEYAITNNNNATTFSMSGNTVQNCLHTGTGEWRAITNTANACAAVTVSRNSILNNAIASTAVSSITTNNFFLLYSALSNVASVTISASMDSNVVVNNSKVISGSTTAATIMNLLSMTNATASVPVTFRNNFIVDNTINFTNGSTASSGTITSRFVAIDIPTCSTATVSGNTIRNFTLNLNYNQSGTAPSVNVFGIRYFAGSGNTTENFLNNKIGPLVLSGTGTVTSTTVNEITGIVTNTIPAAVRNINTNRIDSLISRSNFSTNVFGIRVATGTTNNIINNTMHSFFSGQGSGASPKAAGIRVTSGTTANIYNNMISLDLGAAISPAANSVVTNADGLHGIELISTTASSTINVYHNSIRLAGTGATTFGSSCVFHTASATATTAALNLRNNILVNECTKVGSAVSAGLKRTLPTVANLASASNNIYFSGSTPVQGTNVCYTDAAAYALASTYASLGDMQQQLRIQGATIANRDTNSLYQRPTFNNEAIADMHLGIINCPINDKGAPIASVTTDYDNAARSATTPDIGADEFDASQGGGISASSFTLCSNNTLQVTGTGTPDPTTPWSSSNPAAATISNTGLITGVNPGTTTITYKVSTGCLTTQDFTVNAPPVINTQPATPAAVCAGTNARTVLRVVAAGTGLTYQWQRNGVNISSATLDSFVIANPLASDSGFYKVLVTRAGCTSLLSDSVRLRVNALPTITHASPWVADSLCFSSAVRTTGLAYTGTANGSTFNYSIVWNPQATAASFSPVSGSTLQATPISITVPANAGSASGNPSTTYTGMLRITNTATGCVSAGTTADSFSIVIKRLPGFATQPSTTNQTGCFNVLFPTLQVQISSGIPQYQWFRNTVASNIGGDSILSATSASYTPPSNTADSLYYYATVRNQSTGCIGTSNVSGYYTVFPTPVINTQPVAPAVVCDSSGGKQVIRVSASGTGLTYLWFKNGTSLVSQTTDSLVINNSQVSDSGFYKVRLRTPSGCIVFSDSVKVRVNPRPVISGSFDVCLGGQITLTGSGGTPDATTPWASSNTGVASVSNTGIVTGLASGTTLITYKLNTGCSRSQSVSTNLPPSINTQPVAPAAFCAGSGSQTLRVSVSGSGLTYQWLRNGNNITSATLDSFTLANPSLSDSGFYKVRVTRAGCASILSDSVRVTVNVVPVLTHTNPWSATAVCNAPSAQNTPLAYTNATGGSSFTYSIIWNPQAAAASFAAVNNVSLSAGSVSVAVPSGAAPNNYRGYVRVTNNFGCASVNSVNDSFSIRVNVLPTIFSGPSAAAVARCLNATPGFPQLTASTSSTTFQWYRNTSRDSLTGTLISAANGTFYNPPNNSTLANYYYYFTTTDGATGCSRTSNVSGLHTVNPLPTVSLSVPAIAVSVCSTGIAQNTTLNYSTPANAPDRYSISWSATPGNSFAGVNDAVLSPGQITFAVPASTGANSYTGFLSVLNSVTGCRSSSTSFTVPVGTKGLWQGANAAWTNAGNWCDGIPPTNTVDVTIPTTPAGGNFPQISTGATVRNIIIAAGASLNIAVGGVLSVSGSWNNFGTFTDSGTIRLVGSANQIFPGTVPTYMNVLEVSNNAGVTIDAPFTISGALLPTAGAIALGSNDITIRSTRDSTARVGNVGGSFSYSGSGRFIVERFVDSSRRWRHLAVPVNSTQTINAAWQEGNAPNVPGTNNLGTLITSFVPTATALGFDAVSPGGTSMKYFNHATQEYTLVPNTISTGISRDEGYMCFVRGDRRSLAVFGNTVTNPTVLRHKGQLFTGSKTFTSNLARTFMSIGNPYASAVDFRGVTRDAGIKPFITVWDPRLDGSFNLGQFLTFGFNSVTGNYENLSVPSTSSFDPVNNFIQSGQAFFVERDTTQASGSVTFNEGAKVSGSRLVFRPGNGANQAQTMASSIYLNNTNGTTTFIDGVSVDFDNRFSNTVDYYDATKFENPRESYAIVNLKNLLAIERRKLVSAGDTIYLSFKRARQASFSMRFTFRNMNRANLDGYLLDRFTNTRTLLNLDGTSSYSFTVNSTAASYAENRFCVYFIKSQRALILPTLTTKSAGKAVNLEWTVPEGITSGTFEILHSFNGEDFEAIAENMNLLNETGAQITRFTHSDLEEGVHYYQVRFNPEQSAPEYSNIARSEIVGASGNVKVVPNPVENGIMNIRLSKGGNGRYHVRLVSSSGQVVLTKTILRREEISIFTINTGRIGAGTYQLHISAPDGTQEQTAVMIK